MLQTCELLAGTGGKAEARQRPGQASCSWQAAVPGVEMLSNLLLAKIVKGMSVVIAVKVHGQR